MDVSRKAFAEQSKNAHRVRHVDNAGDCYAFTNGASNDLFSQVVIDEVINGIDSEDPDNSDYF